MEWDGVEDGEIFYTGKIATFTPDELAAEADINADRTIFGIELSILEVAGDPGDGGPPLPTTAEQRADLDTRLRAAVKAWLVDHAITPDAIGSSTSSVTPTSNASCTSRHRSRRRSPRSGPRAYIASRRIDVFATRTTRENARGVDEEP